MVSKKLLSLADLPRAQIFYIYEVTKVVIIYENKHLILETFQIVIPCLRNFNNS